MNDVQVQQKLDLIQSKLEHVDKEIGEIKQNSGSILKSLNFISMLFVGLVCTGVGMGMHMVINGR